MKKLHQLLQLELPPHLFIAALLEQLHELVPSYSNTYLWLDRQSHIVNIYDEKYSGVLIEQFQNFLQKAEHTDINRLKEWIVSLQSPLIIDTDSPTTPATEKLYRLAFFQSGYQHSLCLPIFINGSDTKIGILILHRQALDPTFTEQEVSALKSACEIIAIGLYLHQGQSSQCIHQWKEGVVVIDAKSRIQRICPSAENLVVLASQAPRSRPLESDESINFSRFVGMEALVKELSQELTNSNNCISTNNHWGSFQITGFIMRDIIGRRAPQICINIKWLVPLPLILFENIQHCPLTPRQKDITLFYACGESGPDIANKLDLSLYTVKEHLKNVFERLEVHSQKALIERILYK